MPEQESYGDFSRAFQECIVFNHKKPALPTVEEKNKAIEEYIATGIIFDEKLLKELGLVAEELKDKHGVVTEARNYQWKDADPLLKEDILKLKEALAADDGAFIWL